MALCRLCGRPLYGCTSCVSCNKIWHEDIKKGYLPEALQGKNITEDDYPLEDWERMRFAELDYEEGKITLSKLEEIAAQIISRVLQNYQKRIGRVGITTPCESYEDEARKIRARYRYSGTRNS